MGNQKDQLFQFGRFAKQAAKVGSKLLSLICGDLVFSFIATTFFFGLLITINSLKLSPPAVVLKTILRVTFSLGFGIPLVHCIRSIVKIMKLRQGGAVVPILDLKNSSSMVDVSNEVNEPNNNLHGGLPILLGLLLPFSSFVASAMVVYLLLNMKSMVINNMLEEVWHATFMAGMLICLAPITMFLILTSIGGILTLLPEVGKCV